MKIKTINIIIIYSLFFSNTSYTMLKENDSSESVFKKNADEIGKHAHYILAYRKKNNLKKTLFYAMCGIITFFLSLKIKKNIEKGEPPFFNTSKFPFTFLKKIKLLEEYVINQISYYQKKYKFHIYQYTVIGIRYMIPILSIIIENRHLKENNKIKQDYLKIFILLSKHCTEIIENQYKQANSNTKDNSNIKDNFSITYRIDDRWYNALRTLADYQKWHPLGLVYPCLKKIHDYYSDDRDINKLDYGWFRDFKVQKDGDTDATTDFEEMYKFIMQNLFNQTDSTEKRVEFSELFLHNESLYKKVKFSLIMHNIVLFVIIFILAYLIYQQELMFARYTRNSLNATIKAPRTFFEKDPCFYKINNRILYLGKKPRSGSQSTQLKVGDFNELCEEAIKNNYMIYGYADETFSGVDSLSLPNLIDSQKGPKEAFALGILHFGIIEHDDKKMNYFGCSTGIEFPIQLSNNTMSFSRINHHVIIKQGSDSKESLESTEILNEDEFDNIYDILSDKSNQAGTEFTFYFEIIKDKGQEQFKEVTEETFKKERSRNNNRFISVKHFIKTSTDSENKDANVKISSKEIIIKPMVAIVCDANKNKFLFQIDFTVKPDPHNKENFIPKLIPISGTKDRFKAVKMSTLFLNNKTILFKNEKDNSENNTSSLISDFTEPAHFIEGSINKERSDNNFNAIKEYTREKEEECPSLFYWNDWEVTE